MSKRFLAQQAVIVKGDVGTSTLDGIPDGEIVRVFEDYGTTHVNVMRSNGQLRAVLRTCVSNAN